MKNEVSLARRQYWPTSVVPPPTKSWIRPELLPLSFRLQRKRKEVMMKRKRRSWGIRKELTEQVSQYVPQSQSLSSYTTHPSKPSGIGSSCYSCYTLLFSRHTWRHSSWTRTKHAPNLTRIPPRVWLTPTPSRQTLLSSLTSLLISCFLLTFWSIFVPRTYITGKWWRTLRRSRSTTLRAGSSLIPSLPSPSICCCSAQEPVT